MVVLDLKSLQQDALAIDVALELGEVQGAGGQDLVEGPAHLTGSLTRRQDQFDLRARLTGRLTLECGRCLEPFGAALAVPFFLILVPVADEQDPARAAEDEDDPAVFHAAGGQVDLRSIAAEQVYLNLPLKPVCNPACRGLCPTCGSNRNRIECGCRAVEVDPRLAPLLELKHRDTER